MSSSHAEELEALLRSSAPASGSALKPVLARLSSEVRERTEQGSVGSYDFLSTTVEALAKIKGASNADLRLDCLFNIGLFFIRTGYGVDAISSARLMSDLAMRVASKPWIRKSNVLAGIAYGEIGGVSESVIGYANALMLARELEDRQAEGAALIGLSATFNYGSLYHEALRCSQGAAMIFEELGDFAILAHALTNMAQAYLSLEDYTRGFDAIEKALRLSPEAHDGRSAFSLCIREFTYVHLALELGKVGPAREHSVLCHQYSLWGGNPRAKVLADIAVGLCEVKTGNPERGFKYLDSALSNSTDFSLKLDALKALASAYEEVGKPEIALERLQELLGAVRAAREKEIAAVMSVQSGDFPEKQFLPSTNDMRALELREAKLEAKVAKREVFHSRMEMLERLAIAADLKEEDSGEHGYRVGRLSALLATELGWESEACTALEMAARLHDIGKVGVPDRILFNSQKLKDAEREFIATHTIIGSEMLAKSDIPHLRIAQEIALHHHEWWNGEGYPSKLHGKRIPVDARIVALADVFDALTHGRPFAKPWPAEEAIAEVRRRRGTQFDPELTDRFLALVERLLREQPNLDDYLGKAGRNSPFLLARTKIRRLLAEKHQNESKNPSKDAELQI